MTVGGPQRIPDDRPPASPVARLLPVANAAQSVLDGAVSISVIEVMANAVAVHWRIAPAPSAEVVLGGAVDESTLNLGQIEDREWEVLSKTRLLYLGRLHHLCRPHLSDEIGTVYRPLPNRDSKGWNAGDAVVEETHGVSTFGPAPPTAAKVLMVEICGAAFRFDL